MALPTVALLQPIPVVDGRLGRAIGSAILMIQLSRLDSIRLE